MLADSPLPLGEVARSTGEGGLSVSDLGLISYDSALALQDRLVAQRLAGEITDTLLLLEHPPVITLGRRGSREDIYASDALLYSRGIEVHQATRGGLVTYHGPGQLVGYPIVNVRARRLTIPCYVRALENAIIDALVVLGISASLNPDHVGVFTKQGKIAAIGVAQRHGITLHGFAVNLQPDLSHFDLINPCGLAELGVTSAAALLGHPVEMSDFKRTIAGAVEHHLNIQSCAT
ncbi:MAG TPA: lipoyl(octanoyl) transferase LipB [Chloroflexota bacterium]|nr:lipoyl(octanoyl) transferase LipB [Chloroflexota bacterium]